MATLKINTQKSIVQKAIDAFNPFAKNEAIAILKREVNNLTEKLHDVQAYGGSGRYLFSLSFNGEKNQGEAGPIIDYWLDYDGLRLRSHQAYVENKVFSTIINRVATWIISSGLKLNSQPVISVLKSEKIDIDEKKFNEVMENRFAVWAKSRSSSYSNMENLHSIAMEAFLNSKIGGDVLVILRYINGALKVQLIDGIHIRGPVAGTDYYAQILANGNQLRNGVEMDPATKEHIAYWVQVENPATGAYDAGHYERIPCRSKSTGLLMAYLVKGKKNRIDNYRTMPLLAIVLEDLKILERYTTATLTTAEERAKVALTIEHDVTSTGENPMVDQLAHAFDPDRKPTDIPRDIAGNNLAKTVAATTNKQVFNMPIGSKLQSHDIGDGQTSFKEFHETHAYDFCAAAGIPPNVAFSIYNDSFSASRAAIKDWEHTIFVNREDFTFQFYQPIYEFFMHLQILQNKVDAPGYLTAFAKQNEMAINAYRNSRFTGPKFQGIDPYKEVQAIRLQMGETGASIPLTTAQMATENLDLGDFEHNMIQYADEYKRSIELGLDIEPLPPPTITIGNNKKKPVKDNKNTPAKDAQGA